MPKTFAELMEQFRNPGETGIPETFETDLTETFNHELSVRDAAISERDQKILDAEKAREEADKEVLRVKAVNYDLMVSAPKAGEPVDDNLPAGDNEPGGIESLFE